MANRSGYVGGTAENRVTVRMGDPLYSALDEAADGCSKSAVVRRALWEYLAVEGEDAQSGTVLEEE